MIGKINMSKEQRISALKSYLGEYYEDNINSKVIADQIKSDIFDPKRYAIGYQVNDPSLFKQIIRVAILCSSFLNGEFRYIRYKVCDAYIDIVEKHFRNFNDDSNPEDSRIIGSLTIPELVIIYSPENSIKNKSIWPTCLSIAESRSLKSKKTVFITFKSEPDIDKKIEFIGMPSQISKRPKIPDIL